jgi:sRNA-binding protein
MTEAKTKTQPAPPAANRRASQRRPFAPWIEAILADWRKRWPAAFTKPVPLAAGFSGRIKAALRAEGTDLPQKSIGVTIHQWTHQGAYLYAVMRGEMRRDLDGSEAGVPDEEARQQAKQVLAERAARRAERERQRQAEQQAAEATVSPAQVDHSEPT